MFRLILLLLLSVYIILCTQEEVLERNDVDSLHKLRDEFACAWTIERQQPEWKLCACEQLMIMITMTTPVTPTPTKWNYTYVEKAASTMTCFWKFSYHVFEGDSVSTIRSVYTLSTASVLFFFFYFLCNRDNDNDNNHTQPTPQRYSLQCLILSLFLTVG